MPIMTVTDNLWSFYMYNIAEKRRFKRIEKPYMTRFRIKPAGTWDNTDNEHYNNRRQGHIIQDYLTQALYTLPGEIRGGDQKGDY